MAPDPMENRGAQGERMDHDDVPPTSKKDAAMGASKKKKDEKKKDDDLVSGAGWLIPGRFFDLWVFVVFVFL